jgi:hypothetical protein
MEPGRLGTNGPTRRRAPGRAARRPGLRTRSRAQRGQRMHRHGHDSENEARRAARGPGPKSSTRAERGALTDRMMAVFAPRLSCIQRTYGMARVDHVVA